MALQLYVQPRGGELIGQGIMEAANSIASGIEKHYQRKKENEQMEQATSFFSRAAQADPELSKMLGVADPKDTAALKAGIKGLGGPQKFMQMAGLYQEMQAQKVAQQRAQADMLRAETDRMQAEYEMSQGPFQPEIINLPDGTRMARTSKNSAQVLNDKERYDNAGTYVRRKDGSNPITAVKNRDTGEIGVVKDGKFTVLNPDDYMPSTTSDANPYMNEEQFNKFNQEFKQKEVGVKALNKFMAGVQDIPQGVNKLSTRISAAAKTIAGAELSDEEKKMGVAKARQQRLLGALRTQILGPGVLTEIDAQRIMDATGGDVQAITTSPQVMNEVLGDILQEKFADYSGDLDVYNSHVAGRYGRAGYKQRERVELFKGGAQPARPVNDLAAAAAAELARRQKK